MSFRLESISLELENVVLGVTHDAGPSKGRLERLRGRFPDADAVVFGHSHMPLHEQQDGFQIFNPGSPIERRRAPHRSMASRPWRATRSSFATSHCHDLRVTARAIAVLGVLGIAALSGCGSSGGDSTTIPGGADPATVRVIRGWADELRAGDVPAASERFAIPSVIQNGTPPLRLTSRSEVEAFNRSLPCGATLTEAVSIDRYTIATFKLTERPGPGECGNGVGETAKTAFVVRKGLITQWRRVVDSEGTSTTQGPVV